MPERIMTFQTYPYSAFQYEPSPTERFSGFEVRVPVEIASREQETEVNHKIEEVVWDSCGYSGCISYIVLNTLGKIGDPEARLLQGGKFVCSREGCSLDDSGSSGDREPVMPQPPLPTQSAEVSLVA